MIKGQRTINKWQKSDAKAGPNIMANLRWRISQEAIACHIPTSTYICIDTYPGHVTSPVSFSLKAHRKMAKGRPPNPTVDLRYKHPLRWWLPTSQHPNIQLALTCTQAPPPQFSLCLFASVVEEKLFQTLQLILYVMKNISRGNSFFSIHNTSE